MIRAAVRGCYHLGGRSLLLQTCRRTQARVLHGAAAAGVTQGDKKMKTFDDLPGPSLLTNIYWFFIRGYILYGQEIQEFLTFSLRRASAA
ncbi:hypothetical protein GDO81_021449 [Engystomops pustulosus]|uniref:Uncharacterized protein n=1 Tax=Engystomops pustulosus TaxID=76066 RepID=A0AAV6ZCG8_ENGPU|nr:hypothetical protein GDO81_021449 [Engystomops pustulosus]